MKRLLFRLCDPVGSYLYRAASRMMAREAAARIAENIAPAGQLRPE